MGELGNISGWRSLKSVAGWDKFTLYVKEDCEPPKYKLRWTDGAESSVPERLRLEILSRPVKKPLGVIAEVISPIAYIHDRQDPPFGEIWPDWEAFRAEETTIQRQVLLRSRWNNYYRDRLGPHRCSNIESELKKFRDELLKHGKPWKKGVKTSKGKSHPNTIDEIVNTPRRAVNRAISKNLVTNVPMVDITPRVGLPGAEGP